MKECNSSHMSDKSIQTWIASLPLVEITRVSSPTTNNTLSNSVDSELIESLHGKKIKLIHMRYSMSLSITAFPCPCRFLFHLLLFVLSMPYEIHNHVRMVGHDYESYGK